MWFFLLDFKLPPGSVRLDLRFCHAVHRPAEILSVNAGSDLVAASILGDLAPELCHVVLPLTPKVSLGSGLPELLVLGCMGVLVGVPRLESGVSASSKGHCVVSFSCWVTKVFDLVAAYEDITDPTDGNTQAHTCVCKNKYSVMPVKKIFAGDKLDLLGQELPQSLHSWQDPVPVPCAASPSSGNMKIAQGELLPP